MIAEYNKGEPLTFRHESLDSHGGQSFMVLYASDSSGAVVGKIDYIVYQDLISIGIIKTEKTEQRKGVATAMAKELQRQYPDSEIAWGMSTRPGEKFLKSLSRKFIPNEEYVKIKQRIDMLQKKKQRMQSLYDKWHEMFNTEPSKANDLRAKMEALNEPFNRTGDELYDLQGKIGNMRPGKWMINI
jgi:hypothetical protein